MALKDIELGFGGKKKSGKGKKMKRRNMPVKRSINLAASNEKPIDLRIAIPAIVLIILASILLSKFFVVDRLIAMSRAQGEVSAMQAQLDAGYAALTNMDELKDTYGHYTYSGMTQEELGRTDRVKVLQLIQKVVIPEATVNNWSISGNILTLNIERSTLQDINLLVQQLNQQSLVSYCTVTTAATGRNVDTKNVSAQVLVYLNSDEGTQEEAASASQEGDVVEDAVNGITDTVVGGVAGGIVGDLQAGKEELENGGDNT